MYFLFFSESLFILASSIVVLMVPVHFSLCFKYNSPPLLCTEREQSDDKEFCVIMVLLGLNLVLILPSRSLANVVE